jgi:hypothetical protein
MRTVLAAGLAAAGFGLVGCAPQTGSVSGSVTFAGKPVPAGLVALHYPNGQVVSAGLRPDGRFELPVAPVGPTAITVQTPAPPLGPAAPLGVGAGAVLMPGGPPAGNADPANPMMAGPTGVRIPGRYTDPGRSGLAHTVTAGRSVCDIVLEAGK